MEKLKKAGITIITVIVISILVISAIIEGYTFIMGISWKTCGFDGAYICQEDKQTLIVIFDDNEMVFYTDDKINISRISYEYSGIYYNKGLFGRFLTPDDKWIKIDGADKAGDFYADCKTSVATNGWGDFEYLDETEIEKRGTENDINYSKRFRFKVSGDSLTLILEENGEYYHIPLTETRALTGDNGEMVEYLDQLWEYEFE